MAGAVGVEPWSFTFGELAEMAYGRRLLEWDQTSSIIAMIHNSNVSKKSQTKSPSDFNPVTRRKKRMLNRKESMSALKEIFCKEN